MNAEEILILRALFEDLVLNAYNKDYHTYYHKQTNQIVRKHFENLISIKNQEAESLARDRAVEFAKWNLKEYGNYYAKELIHGDYDKFLSDKTKEEEK